VILRTNINVSHSHVFHADYPRFVNIGSKLLCVFRLTGTDFASPIAVGLNWYVESPDGVKAQWSAVGYKTYNGGPVTNYKHLKKNFHSEDRAS